MEDFFQKPYLKGGLTYDQINYLYSHILKQKAEEYKFQAAMMGVELKDDNEAPNKNETVGGSGMFFKDPAEYENLSDTEKEKQTEKMMGTFSNWSTNVLKGK